jgi:hypothetical protein
MCYKEAIEFHSGAKSMNMKKTVLSLCLGLLFGLSSAYAQMAAPAGVGITKIEITKRQPAFGGASFGSAGPYEMLIGTAWGELDPKDPTNTGIVNIQYAPVNARGHVEYSMDITIMKPVDINKGNGRLIYDVVNRGHEKALSDLNLSAFNSTGPGEVNDPATALLMKRGYTVAWSGWEAEDSAETAKAGLLKAKFPIATRDGKPIVGMSREEFSSIPAAPSFTRMLTYPAAKLDQSAATLTVREREEDPRKPLPASSWSYVDAKHVKINVAPGFDREALYEFIYPATDPVIEGIAFATVRDFVLFLRTAEKDSMGNPNPVHPATPYKAVLAVGVSLSGRFVRDFVYQDFNIDSAHRIVFDGILDVVSGARMTNTNTEFSQPGRFPRQHEDHLFPGDQFPFTFATTTDALTGKTDGIQLRCTKSHSCPKFFQVDTNTESWQGRESLVAGDTSGKPVPIPDNVRIYVPTGVSHESNDLNEVVAGTADKGKCQQYGNPLKYRHYVRGLFIALDSWVVDGVAPPPSQYPNFKDHTLITLDQAAKIWPAIPGWPFSPMIDKLHPMDYSHQPPTFAGPEYPLFVALTNADGNPIGGVVPPEITVPTGTHSGRNIRAEGFADGDLCSLDGSFMPFAVTKKERMEKNDPRLSLEERYHSQQEFTAKLKAAADKLVKERILLPEDAATISSIQLPKTFMAEKKP